MTDWELLRQYRENRSNEAFRKLADRHMKLVYSTCRRDLDNAQAAEDATQLVFILLARKANTISRRGSVSSWLFGAARFVCKDMIKSEMRRRRREEAAAMIDSHATENKEWDLIEPQLNDALSTLGASDREAVLMRYYSGMSLHEIAGQIGTTEDTARKRVSRAVDKLRHYFQREQATAHLLSLDALLATYCAGSVPARTHTAVMSTLQNLGSAHGAAASLNAHASVLSKKGAIVLMDATVKKALVGLAIIAVIGAGIGVPVTMARIQNARLASQGEAAFIDATPTTEKPADPNQAADREKIISILHKGLNDYCQGDLSRWGDTATPRIMINTPGNPGMTVEQMTQQQQQSLQMMGPFKITETIQSLKIHGDQADLAVTIHLEGTTVKHGQTPAGLRLSSDQTQTSTLRKKNGKWQVDIASMQLVVNGRIG